MDNQTYQIIYLITNTFNIAILLKFMHTFFDKRISSKIVCVLSYLAHMVITSIVYLFIDIPVLNLIVNWVIMFVIALNYNSSMQNRFMVSTYVLLFMAIPECIVGAFTNYFHFSFFSKAGYDDSLGVILARLLTYMEALLFKNFKTAKNNQKVTIYEWIASIFIPITTMILEVTIIQSDNLSQSNVVLSLILIFILNLIAFYLYDALGNSYTKIAKIAVLEKENELYSKQCEIMQSSAEELQSFRHDLSNQFAVISELLNNEKYDLVKEQISALSEKITYSVIYSTTGNIIIDGLINYKLQCAIIDNIKVNSEIAVPCDLELETTDIVTIIGNLLDNSITAVKELQVKDRTLHIKVVYSNDRLIIQTINPYISEINYENGEIISSKEDKCHHGYGLKNIERVVQKYDGYMEINHTNSLFKVDILLYLIHS